MRRRSLPTMFAVVFLFAVSLDARADDATLLRIFLTDGTSLVSYGEPARVGDRVVFSMPAASGPNPPLHLVNLSAGRVDWDRTNRYAASARAAHYIETQAAADYAALSNDISAALNDVTLSTDTGRRLAIVEQARRTLATWPQNHYNYRQTEVRQMLGMLDEAIADLRASTATARFDLNLVAFTDPQTIAEPLLPAPTPKEAIEEVLAAARLVDTSTERTWLLSTALAGIERDAAALAVDWATKMRAETEASLDTERRIDRSYQSLTQRILALGQRRARLADVRGLQRLVDRIHERDRELGGKRPDEVTALITAVEAELDAARRLRLARDHWTLRAPAFRKYNVAITAPLSRFTRLKPSLENIKALAGSSPPTLAVLERAIDQILTQAAAIVPPKEFVAAHALLVSAVQLAGNAAAIRREATIAGDIARAWDASSAAAGALMLGARARSDIQALLRPPQLP